MTLHKMCRSHIPSINLDGINMIHVPQSVSKGVSSVHGLLLALGKKDFVNKHLYDPSSHLLGRKGKYLRPTLVLLSAYAMGADPDYYVDLATAAELLHTSSLIHDDIIDGDKMRRGVPSVHAKFGTEAAILSGDALISKAIQFSSAYGKQVMDSMANAALEMCAGEILDYSFQKRGRTPNIIDYLEIARLKSASLIGASCASVAIHRKSSSASQFYDFGINFGTAFQIKDDISDYKTSPAKAKKPNAVITIAESKGLPKAEAAREAEEMMQIYIKEGLSSLKNKKASQMFSEYAQLLYSY